MARGFVVGRHSIVVVSRFRRPSTSVWRAIDARHSKPIGMVSVVIMEPQGTVSRPSKPAAVLAAVKGTSLRDGLTATLDGHCAQQPGDKQAGMRRCHSPAEQGDGPITGSLPRIATIIPDANEGASLSESERRQMPLRLSHCAQFRIIVISP